MSLLDVLGNLTLGGLPAIWWLTPASATVALVTAFLFHRAVMAHEEGTPKMVAIARAIRQGATAYLIRQYRVIAVVFSLLFLLFLLLARLGLVSRLTPFAFVFGGVFCAVAGLAGMYTATHASARTAHAARQSMNDALRVALEGGAVMGLTVVGLALLGVSISFLFLYYLAPPGLFRGAETLTEITNILVSGVFGASAVALFARLGGGIFTKAADIGADLVGKLDARIPEDDPRNPAVIADNVGDNVGDVAGMGSDLYESYLGSVLATVALGVSATAARAASTHTQLLYLTMPLALAALGVILSILCIRTVRIKGDGEAGVGDIINGIDRGMMCATIGTAVLSWPLVWILKLDRPWLMWGTVLVGLAVGIVIGRVSGYYTSPSHRPTQFLASQAVAGTATVIIEGLAVGMASVVVPIVVVCAGIATSFFLAGGAGDLLMGLYGVGLAAVGMLSTLGFTLSTDAYGPIADNAGGIAQMAGLPAKVRQRTDALDAAGNTTAATGKGFAVGSAALTTLVLLAAFVDQVRFELLDLLKTDTLNVLGRAIPLHALTMQDLILYYDVTLFNPGVIIGLFVGSATVFYFSAMTLSAVGRTATQMVDEVRRQFRTTFGILDGSAQPDYARCVDVATAGAQKQMVRPALLALFVPLVMGVLFGVAGVVALLAGSLAGGFALALTMANAGAAWDNAKKHIEQGAHDGHGSEAHRAAVVGDTVGDPFKDTCGPSLDILIKLMSIVGVVLAGLIASLGPGGLLGLLLP